MTERNETHEPLKVLIVGGGVAGLEAALAIHGLAGDRVATTLLAPNDEFVYRAMAVREPFARAGAPRYPMAPIVEAAGADHIVESLKWLEPRTATVHTSGGRVLGYEALLLALGAHPYDSFRHVTTLHPNDIDGQLHGLIQDVELGFVHRLAFVVPTGFSWPMPVYELALMTAVRAFTMGQEIAISIVTPEPSPLAVFGSSASGAVAALLDEHGIEMICDAGPDIDERGRVSVGVLGVPSAGRGTSERSFDRVVALPELRGMGVPGMVCQSTRGFVDVDSHGRVRNLHNVFAAGDMTNYPVKHGALAAEQAYTVAQEIVGLAGLATTAAPFEPVLQAVLLGGREPLYLRARLIRGRAVSSEFSTKALWDSADKVHAPYLTRTLSGLGTPGPSVRSLAPTS